MQYKIIETGELFPSNEIKARFPNTSLPEVLSTDDLVFLGLEAVPDPEPVPLSAEELAAIEAAQSAQREEQFKRGVVLRTQERLDAFARTRNYDNVLSACTYASSSITKFRLEGQYCVDIRDSTWAALYTLLAEVESGTKPMPATIEEIMLLLPEMVWPA